MAQLFGPGDAFRKPLLRELYESVLTKRDSMRALVRRVLRTPGGSRGSQSVWGKVMRVGIVTGLLALSQGALAQPTGMVFWSGNDLHSALQQLPGSYARTLARGYVMGMSDLYSDM